ncbi:hypothetical protein vseg_009798 [Gypsophila vaccaria]
MDRRSWLWRRKSSDKSSGETESLGSGSGSMSSPSERFSDEQQVYPIQNTQSPEMTLNHTEDTHDSMKILSQKLSAAIEAVNEKEELVKQHAKVAEEAVTGWERAENEMNLLKQQLDAATKRNSTLEDKVIHLDGALKECMRQLRQVREEQDKRIQEAVAGKSENTESTSSELQCQIADISAELEIANAKAEAAISVESDLRLKLSSVEKENVSLQLKLRSQSEELEVRTVERDLSIKRAETVSKQHLESIKRVSKLEAECRQLKAMASKGNTFNDRKSFPDNRSDVKGKNSSTSQTSSPSKIVLMDDFLEMEKLVSSPVQENRGFALGSMASINKHNESGELEAMINRTAELEERIELVEAEKVELGLKLSQIQDKLQLSESSFRQLQTQFNECQNQLKMSQAQLIDANKKTSMLQAELDLAGELRQAIDLELDDANARMEDAEAKRNHVENESRILLSKVAFLEGEVEKERKIYSEASQKCRVLENELSRMKSDSKSWQNQLDMMKEAKEAVEREMKSTRGHSELLESELMTVQAEVKFLLSKINSLENEGENERHLSEEFEAKSRELESELSETRRKADMWESRFTSVNDLKEGVTRELQTEKTMKEAAERKLAAVQAEAESLFARVGSLEHEMGKERSSSAEFAAKCRKLEYELSKLKSEAIIQFAPLSKEELNKQQENELAVAASKLADCKKTIASLGNQLKSLATFEDLFSDSDNQLDSSENDSQFLGAADVEPATLRRSSVLTVQSDSVSSETGTANSCSVSLKAKEKESLPSLVLDKSHKYGIGNIFSRSRSSVRTRNS